MGCNCGKNRRARSAGVQYKYQVTPPLGETEVYMTPMEAKSAIRRHGGGDIRRIQVPAQSSTTVQNQ